MGITFIVIASIIYLILGFSHIFLTLFTKAFEPTNPELLALNKSNHSKMTSKTSLWNGSIGFHISHSLGLIIFGTFYISLAEAGPNLISLSSVFGLSLIVIPIIYLFLPIKYWFILPSVGLALACTGYILGLMLINI